MAGGLPVASDADSRDPAVVRARKEASWARVKGSWDDEEGAGAEVEEEVDEELDDDDEGAQEVDEELDDDEREEAAVDDVAHGSLEPYTPPPPFPPRPRDSAEGLRSVARLREAKRCWAGTGVAGNADDGATEEEEAEAAEEGAKLFVVVVDVVLGEGDGEAPLRGSGEPAALALAAIA